MVNRVQNTDLPTLPRLEGQERVAGTEEVRVRHASHGAVAVDAYWRTSAGHGPLTNLLYEMRRIAADRQAHAAAERVAARDK
ncbi:MAG: hypothetical protein QOJ12_881 [Thermoleophilales bacterium]|nr:hypothetical protein [Thermoleophilales bacterium]